ncbi:MAG: response regulator transcription factor [Dehalococcoidales bacterium]|jgi:DNA-binding response OmpR family regulator
MKKILIVDDNPTLVKLVSNVLTRKEFKVLEASSGQEALRLLFAEKPDLVLLDVVMPGMDGWQTCNRIRDVSDVPIIIFTGNRMTEDDIVHGLDYGADEYLLKRIGNKELVARVRATLRRAELPSFLIKKEYMFSDDFLTLDVAERKVLVNGKRVKLTPIEFRLLVLLVENGRNVLTHQQILENVWGWEYVDDVDYVRIYISHLRRKIEPNNSLPKYILTESGVGYYFNKSNGGNIKTDQKSRN